MDFNFSNVEGFDWDEGNSGKNFKGHEVTDQEGEEVFLHKPFIEEDVKHSKSEQRYQALGETSSKRYLFVSFTIRYIHATEKIRIISARDMNRKEERRYEEIKTNSQF